MRARLHQFVAGFARGDAISNEAVLLRNLFRSWGCESEIFSEPNRVHPDCRRQVRDAAEFAAEARTEDVALLHLSMGSAVNEAFAALRCRRAIIYHNITPGHYFRGINEQIAHGLEKGRAQARALAGLAQVALADSRYNAEELSQMGYRDVRVLPILLNLSIVAGSSGPALFRDGKVNVLFVGRCVPNKKIEDLLLCFHFFQKYVRSDSRLVLVGSYTGLERYHALLLGWARTLELRDVEFCGAVPQDKLAAAFHGAHLFLCASEHEGFCVPLLEAMANDLPVLAFAAAAVPETMDGAGILYHEKRWDMVAEMMGELLDNPGLRQAVIAGQRQRLARYQARDLAAELRAHLDPLLPKPT